MPAYQKHGTTPNAEHYKWTNKSTRAGKKQVATSDVLILDSICVCKKKPSETDKL